MLYRLTIHNIALIENLEVPFGPGLNILSGETGAGKSIIIDAVNLALGERADRGLIRYGTQRAQVEAAFALPKGHMAIRYLQDQGYDDPDDPENVILSRDITLAGKNVCRINGHLVSVSQLKQLSALLVDIHGQHEHQSLLSAARHRAFLDRVAGEDFLQELNEYKHIFSNWREVRKALDSSRLSEQEKARRIEMLRFQLDDIQSAQLTAGEEEQLAERRSYLQNREQIMQTLAFARQALFEGGEDAQSALDILGEVQSAIGGMSRIHQPFEALHAKLSEVYYALEDIDGELRALDSGWEDAGESLDSVEERLNQIYKLKRKYGSSIEEILAYAESIEQEYAELQDSEAHIEQLVNEESALFQTVKEKALALHEKRTQAALSFEAALKGHLQDLGMQKLEIKTVFAPLPQDDATFRDQLQGSGIDQVEFLISPNPGQPLMPLAKIASGGELSRIMLAIKNISATADDIPCMIFDEIDTGISGRIAQAVGEKMCRLASDRQVISVTHLSQIAALGDEHLLVRKTESGENTMVELMPLDEKARISEIARMNAGAQITQIDLDHAQAILKQAQTIRKKLRQRV